jgi:hypothetical protein
LRQAPRSWPLRRSDTYGEALEAFGLESAIPRSADRWLQASDQYDTGRQDETDPMTRFQGAQRDLFLEGLKLRRDHPGIFYAPSGISDQAARLRYRDHCRPLLVRGPRRMFVPWGWGREAELKRTFAYAQCAQQIVDFEGKAHDHLRKAFAKGRVVELARRCLGPAAESLISSTRKF